MIDSDKTREQLLDELRALRLEKETLRAGEARMRMIADSAQDAILMMNSEGLVSYWNPAAERILGYTEGEAIGQNLHRLIVPSKYLTAHQSAFPIFQQTGQGAAIGQSIDMEGRRKDGKEISVQLSLSAFQMSGAWHAVGVIRDITDRKQAENEIKLKNEELHRINAEKDKFFSLIAHDLRSPFNSFLGFTRIMVEDLSTMTLDEIQNIALTMKNSATNVYTLLDNLLEWSRMQRGLIGFLPETIVLLPKVTESLQPVLASAEKKEIGISYEIPENLSVFADGNMLGSAIRNLVTNAVKFTPKGGKVTIAAKAIINNSVEISIRDTGIGMNENILGKLFTIDGETGRNGTEGEPSTGLGLIFCKDFIEKQGGKIWVESEEGKGTTFYFTVPGNP